MKYVILSIADEHLPKLAAWIQALPNDTIRVLEETELEDTYLANILQKNDTRDFVSKDEVFLALKNADKVRKNFSKRH